MKSGDPIPGADPTPGADAMPRRLDDGYQDRLQICEALAAMGLPELVDKIHILERYVAMLLHWSQRMNLTAIRDEPDIWQRHLFDCLVIVPLLRQRLATSGERPATPVLLDAGTGAGLPALMLALAEPSWQLVAVDAVDKKLGFVRQAAAEMGLTNLFTLHARLEKLRLAMASLPDFAQATRHLIQPQGLFCAMKGQEPHAEIAVLKALHPDWCIETVSLRVPGLDAQRCAVMMQASC
ncbi:MAG: 16S rRNA (guanine(527)-N(7))-methyltransferase RsmG [Betaproteobacteria bacterium]|nr:16S rRNA (guanine(527)-N(7))-methyltransferase RsmG [Betaproteobacteria bacterium]